MYELLYKLNWMYKVLDLFLDGFFVKKYGFIVLYFLDILFYE